MQRAEDYARRRRKKLAGLVTYSNGETSMPVLAVQAETTAQSDDGETILNTRTVDWLIDKSEMPWEPENGHRITAADGTVFAVAAVGGEKCYRWHGRDRLTYRIHSKQVAS